MLQIVQIHISFRLIQIYKNLSVKKVTWGNRYFSTNNDYEKTYIIL